MACLLDFGESGNNFIEIGKKPKLLETMLKLRCLDGFRIVGKTTKKRMKQLGKVEIPQEAFLAALKLET